MDTSPESGVILAVLVTPSSRARNCEKPHGCIQVSGDVPTLPWVWFGLWFGVRSKEEWVDTSRESWRDSVISCLEMMFE